MKELNKNIPNPTFRSCLEAKMKALQRIAGWVFILIISVQFPSCAPVGLVKPLKTKQVAASASFGGSLITYSGLVIPMPLLYAGASYGWNEKTTVAANLGFTSMAFGVGQLDVGILRQLVRPEQFHQIGVSGFARIHLLFDKWENNFRWYPEIGLNAYREFGEGKNLVYFGSSAWFETRYPKPGRAADNVWIPMLNLGYIRQREKWNLTLEAKWIAPQINNKNIVVEYHGIGSHGSIGVYAGITRKF